MSSISSELYSLSPQQKCAWTWHVAGESPRVQIACDVDGELDVARLRRAFQEVIRCHEILRSRFVPMPGLNFPVQEVQPEGAAEQFELVYWNASENSIDANQLLEREAIHQNDGKSESPVCAALIPLSANRHLLVISAAATFADVVTLQLLLRSVAENYASPGERRSNDGEQPLQYVEYASWREDSAAQGDDATRQGQSYWNQQISSRPPDVRLAGQRPADGNEFAPGFVPFELPPAVGKKLSVLNRTATQPLEAVLLACWSLFLYRNTDSAALQISVVLDGRPLEEFRSGMGPYAQAVPVLMNVSGETHLNDATALAYQRLLQAALWQDYYIPAGVSGTRPVSEVFGYSFNSDVSVYQGAGVRVKQLAHRVSAYPFELKLDCFYNDETINCSLVYDSRSLSRAYANSIAAQFQAFCEHLSSHPDQTIATVNAFAEGDLQRLLDEWNKTETRMVPEGCIHEFFDRQAARTPNNVAVIFQQEKVTFLELQRRANALARRLRSLGAGPDVPVCLLVEPSVEMIIGLISILKAGSAYVPLETAYPVKERIAHVITETHAPVLVTSRKLRHDIDGLPVKIVLADEPTASDSEPLSLKNMSVPENAAYIIYTSGSTGKPKGVVVQHRSAINLWYALQQAVYKDAPESMKVSVNAPISFDAAVKQVLMLLGGHTLCIIPEDIRTDAHAFVEYIREHRIDVLDCTPSHLNTLLEAGLESNDAFVPSLALIGGEAIDEQLWARLAASRTRFYNVYGPTECTVDSTVMRIAADSRPSIGRTIMNVRTYILDGALQLVPPGVSGELCIGGNGVARGYWDAAALTAQRFVPDPLPGGSGERLYRTGDLARYLPDGTLQYLGRMDHQVKVRGFRVELGEIAATLAECPGVKEAVVHAFKDPGNTRLVGYIVPGGPTSPATSAVREFLQARLPEYMIPVSFVPLESLPLNAHGKLDRKALPDPGAPMSSSKSESRAPIGEIETALARIWSAVLNREQVGARDNFFQLGGHSLLAMRMIARVRKEFAIDIPLPRLFQLPTIEALAVVIEESIRNGSSRAERVSSISRNAIPPMRVNPRAA
jgi:amino acid adenylation domain-containing protein